MHHNKLVIQNIKRPIAGKEAQSLKSSFICNVCDRDHNNGDEPTGMPALHMRREMEEQPWLGTAQQKHSVT